MAASDKKQLIPTMLKNDVRNKHIAIHHNTTEHNESKCGDTYL
jgi:hypothetical protein